VWVAMGGRAAGAGAAGTGIYLATRLPSGGQFGLQKQ